MSDQALIKHICDLNNHAVFALASGRAGKASVTAIREAMLTMDKLCANNPDASSSPEPALSFHTVPVPHLNDDHFYIFSYAFSLNPVPYDRIYKKMGTSNMAYCCAVLTFNMALTYHQLGQRSGDSRKLRAACHLYGNCVEMATSVLGVPPPIPGDNLFTLQMMALNNAAQIQYALANFAESQQLLSNVRHMMQLLFERSRHPNNVLECLPSEALDEINLNAVVCLHPTSAPTA